MCVPRYVNPGHDNRGWLRLNPSLGDDDDSDADIRTLPERPRRPARPDRPDRPRFVPPTNLPQRDDVREDAAESETASAVGDENVPPADDGDPPAYSPRPVFEGNRPHQALSEIIPPSPRTTRGPDGNVIVHYVPSYPSTAPQEIASRTLSEFSDDSGSPPPPPMVPFAVPELPHSPVAPVPLSAHDHHGITQFELDGPPSDQEEAAPPYSLVDNGGDESRGPPRSPRVSFTMTELPSVSRISSVPRVPRRSRSPSYNSGVVFVPPNSGNLGLNDIRRMLNRQQRRG